MIANGYYLARSGPSAATPLEKRFILNLLLPPYGTIEQIFPTVGAGVGCKCGPVVQHGPAGNRGISRYGQATEAVNHTGNLLGLGNGAMPETLRGGQNGWTKKALSRLPPTEKNKKIKPSLHRNSRIN